MSRKKPEISSKSLISDLGGIVGMKKKKKKSEVEIVENDLLDKKLDEEKKKEVVDPPSKNNYNYTKKSYAHFMGRKTNSQAAAAAETSLKEE